MLGKSAKDQHPPDALLHAYVADEVDPAQRAVIAAHLEACDACRVSIRRVESMAHLFAKMEPPDLDELRWRRIGQAVMSQLERRALNAPHRTVLEVLMGTAWPIAAVAAAVVVAIFIWVAPRPGPVAPVQKAIATAPSERPAEAAPAMSLPPGVSLRLSDDARATARASTPSNLEIDLAFGQLDVRVYQPLAPLDSIVIRTPAFITAAHAADFSVRFEASQFVIDVRDGEATLRGRAIESPLVVHGGQSHRFRSDGGLWREADVPAEKPTPQHAKSKTPSSGRAAAEPPRSKPPEAEASPIHTSNEGETSVQVVPPLEDQVALQWKAALDAYYETRDVPRALALAEAVAASAPNRPEAAFAREMRCEAYVAIGHGDQAIAACQAMLEHESRPEEQRAIHYRLATIYRTLLHDCRSAIDEYGRSIVFGRASSLDDDALVWRAHCSIELGDRDGARRDIYLLESRASVLTRPHELEELKKRLGEAPETEADKK